MKGNCNGADKTPGGIILPTQMYVKGQTYEVSDELAKKFEEVKAGDIVNPKESNGPKGVEEIKQDDIELDESEPKEKQMDLNPENKMQDMGSDNK